MPDLEYATSLFLHEMDSLESFSVPKLTSIGWASIHIPSDIDLLEMSALEESGTLSLVGHFTDVSFPALHTVAAGDVVILNSSPADKTETRMNISFPALNSSDSIYISGRTSHVSLPELTRLASPWMQGSGTNFSLWGETIDFDLPKLHTVDGSIYFEGNMTSLSLPSLDRVDQNLTITAGNPLSIDIPELRYAEVIHLTGKIKSVELPALIEYSDLHVDTDLELDCNAFMGEFDTAPGQKNVTCVSRGAVEDSDATDETTEESTTQDDERGDEETGNDNGSASLHVRGVGAMVAISILFVGLGGLWN
ncbi:hypothetical protein BJY00DRAFT_279171 [Aspergillus carlsbadensis]|nr:hypothetical protein BJY00DRAFT_279171 [Aspergillus carlsbadensis]